MLTEAATRTQTELTDAELRALASAGAWYVNYHGPMIAEQADDRSVAALATRERFLHLHAALWKLGVELRLPDALSASR
jgi:hypothetical protein